MPRVGDIVELEILDLAYGGAGVARLDGWTLFVRGSLPGQKVRARISKRKRTWGEARVLEVLQRAPNQVPAVCAHFGQCGGCLWQELDYPAQVSAKATQVRDSLVRLGGFADPPMAEPLPASEIYHYRNKMEFSFSLQVWRVGDQDPGHFGCGLHVRGWFDKVLNNTECHLTNPWAVSALQVVRAAAQKTGLPPWNSHVQQGFFRFLIVREGVNTGERMASLITWPCEPGSPEANTAEGVLAALHEADPGITSLIHGVTDSKAGVAFSQSHRAVFGPDQIHERLLEDTFGIGPNTFFQTNTHQAERLFTLALDLAGPRTALAYDLYCGVGALTLPLSRRHDRVVGVELIEASIDQARYNATQNNRTNADFIALDARKALTRDGLRNATGEITAGPPQLVMVDPPREGMHEDVVKGLIALAPPRLVYVSCNPTTFARDAALLVAGGYRLKTVVPVDMFPQTGHIELVGAFDRDSEANRSH